MHTLQRFKDSSAEILLVLPPNEIDRWNTLKVKYGCTISHTLVAGGKSRFHSVKNGLSHVANDCIVAIHDGVRPLCSSDLINRCFEEAELHSNSIPALKVTDTIRDISKEKSIIVDREKLRVIQTPQCFLSTSLKSAYDKTVSENFTDDAGVFESAGHSIHLVDGEKNNIKITEPSDLIVASALLKEFF
jgi:2-C-methyl-D-erythritol 4-phosphate cytidylyltransferase